MWLDMHAFARSENVIDRIAAAGQPDLAAQNGEFAAASVDLQRYIAVDLEGPAAARNEMRNHHQSPGNSSNRHHPIRARMIGVDTTLIQ
ncbi:MAG: hypothetical protein ABIO45_06990 [Burkholderiaceae bacterium]